MPYHAAAVDGQLMDVWPVSVKSLAVSHMNVHATSGMSLVVCYQHWTTTRARDMSSRVVVTNDSCLR